MIKWIPLEIHQTLETSYSLTPQLEDAVFVPRSIKSHYQMIHKKYVPEFYKLIRV